MKSIIVGILCVLVGLFVHAQEIVMITQPAANKVGIQDAFEVKYIIKNAAQVENFNLPDLRDFQVLSGPSQMTSTSIINGERSVSFELTYVFRAKRKGQLVIPGGIATSRGREYKSNNVTIEVIDGSVRSQQQQRQRRDPFDDPFFQDPFGDDMFADMQKQHQQMMKRLQQGMQGQMPQGQMIPQSRLPNNRAPEIISKQDIAQNLFIKVDVDKTNVTLGEQITATYKLYARMPMEVNLTKLPSLVGFWSQDFKIPQPPKPTREVIGGKEYQVFEIKRTALFPTQTGTLELDAAEAEGMAQLIVPKKVKQDNPFDRFFGRNGQEQYVTTYEYEETPVKLRSSPIKIQVTDLPTANKPSSFNGAVGQYTIESNIDKTELTTDDNAIITLRVSGSGNLKLIGTPALKIPDDIDTFDPTANDTITNTNDIIAGYKTFTYTLAPQIAGTFTIPPAAFSYYDPILKTYKTLNTPSYTLHVKPGKNTRYTADNRLPKDIHDIHSKALNIQKESKSITLPTHPLFWSGFALPFLAYLGFIFVRRKEDELRSNATLFKNKKANKIALKRLATAEKFLKTSAQGPFYEETSKAVWLYLSDKLSIPLSVLSKEVAEEKMTEKKITSDLQAELFRITKECEMALYSPESGSMKMHQTYSDTLKLIGKLEDHLS